MNILSLFDGMSCGQIAFEKLGIKFDGIKNKYYASEIKKHAIETTLLNYPNTIQMGDVTKIKGSELDKIDILIGGSPCQDFSIANKKREGLNGVKSSLFYEYIRLLKECNPKFFLLENVVMEKSQEAIISHILNIEPIRINGNLVSAANRDRLYWTNINADEKDLFGNDVCTIKQPDDKRIMLKDIITSGFVNVEKANCLKTHHGFNENNKGYIYKNFEMVKKRFENMGMENIVFESPDFDYLKGIRHFNNTELERLHNIPEGYTKHLSRKKAHDLIGDGWTVDVIVHIFKELKC
jgi:DNA (cytosine-5)-methyltransferase 3A